jgi:hypothetical protein
MDRELIDALAAAATAWAFASTTSMDSSRTSDPMHLVTENKFPELLAAG